MLVCDDRHRVGVFHRVRAAAIGDKPLKQREQQMAAASDERRQRRKAVLTGRLGVLDRAFIRLRIDAVARQLDRLFALLAVHLRKDAVTRRAAEGLERPLQPIALALLQIAAVRETIAFLDHDLEEVLRARIDPHLSTKIDRLEPLRLADRLDLERLDNARLLSG